MKNLCALFILMCLSIPALAQDYSVQGEEQVYSQSIDGLKSPDTEHRMALSHLKYKVFREDRPFIKYFTLYSVPGEKREEVRKVLDVWIHSLIDSVFGGKKYSPVKQISDTLFYIDIRDYGWINETWDIVAQEDIYIQEPWINDEDIREIEELLINTTFFQQGNFVSSNILLRGDWFIFHTSDTTAQDDVGREPLYYVLPYTTLGEPQNLDDFRDAWQVDVKNIEALGLEKGTIVEEGRSTVALNQRQITVARTPYGYYYETNDTKASIGKFNYIDNLQPFGLSRKDRDASEEITVNQLGLQVYFLTDGVGNRVEFADPTVARDATQRHDVRVKTARSCIVCHSKGLNDVDNQFRRTLRAGISLRIEDRDFQNLVENYFMHDFNARIASDKPVYSLAIQRVANWQPEKFTKNYNEFMIWYEQGIDLQQAALETGVSIDVYRNNVRATSRGTLAQLVTGGKVSRQVWEEGEIAPFIESMLFLYRSKLVLPNNQMQPQKSSKNILRENPRNRNFHIKYKDITKKTIKNEATKKKVNKPNNIKQSVKIKYQNKIYSVNIGTILKDEWVLDKHKKKVRILKAGELVYINTAYDNDNLLGIFYHTSPTFRIELNNVEYGAINQNFIKRGFN